MSALDSVPPKKIVHWQMFVLVRMNCATTWIAQPVKGFKPFKGYAICGRQSGCIASAREIDFTAQTVWWCCACANCVVALRMRKLCGGTAHAQTVRWNCACANCVVELRICARWRGTLTLDIIWIPCIAIPASRCSCITFTLQRLQENTQKINVLLRVL